MSEKSNVTSISISTSTMVRAVLVLLSLFLLWFLHELVLVVLSSIVIASFVESSIPSFRKVGIGRVFSIVIMYVILVIVLSGLFYLFVPLLITEVYNFSVFISEYIPDVSFLNFFQNEQFSGAKDVVNALSNNFSLSSLLTVSKAFVSNLSGGFFKVLSIGFGSIFNFVLIILLSFYLSIPEKGIEGFLRIIVPIQYEDYVVDLWDRSSKKIALWVRGQMLVAFVVAVLIYLILSLLGIKYALLLSIIVGIMEMVPYGVLVALVPAFAFSYLSDGVVSAFLVTGAYLIVHQFEIFLFSPVIIKKVVGLSPIVIILSVLIGFELGGVWGAILAIPLAIVVMEFFNDLEKDKTLARTSDEKR